MQTVGSREFKNRMGRYLRKVRQGKTLIITDRGTPVAIVGPTDEAVSKPTDLRKRLEELEGQGFIRLARKPLRSIRPVKSGGKPASRMIIEDRR